MPAGAATRRRPVRSATMPHSLLYIVRESTAYLQRCGSPSARLDAEVLVAHALHLRRLDLYLQFDRPLEEPELASLRPLLRKRGRGCPVAYLTAEREFHGHAFTVSPAVLIPRPETELLVDRTLAALDRQGPGPVADLGTGSGCIAVSLALERPGLRVDAVDQSQEALRVAAANAERHGVADRVIGLLGDWTAPLRGRGPYRAVVSNPPYVTTAELAALDAGVRNFEPVVALDAGVDGLDPYRAILAGLPPLLAPDASVLFEIDPRRADGLQALCAAAWPAAAVARYRDLSGRERVLEVDLAGAGLPR